MGLEFSSSLGVLFPLVPAWCCSHVLWRLQKHYPRMIIPSVIHSFRRPTHAQLAAQLSDQPPPEDRGFSPRSSKSLSECAAECNSAPNMILRSFD